MVWDGQIHQCQLYDRACRVKQCFRCYNYGHIGTQCNASQVCGYCAEPHESKHCRQKGLEGFAPRCAVCKDAHTAWSNACPARKKELHRVEQAKEVRSIYWHVPLKENTTTRVLAYPRGSNVRSEARTPPDPILAQPASRRPTEVAPPMAPVVDSPPPVKAPQQILAPTADQGAAETRAPLETTEIETPAAPPIEEIWGTSATQTESGQQHILNIDPQLIATELSGSHTLEMEDSQPQQSLYPGEGIEGVAMQEADSWLQNIVHDNGEDWLGAVVGIEPSPMTSIATDTRTALGQIYKACRCPEHQEIYGHWPTENAEPTIARCMGILLGQFRTVPSTVLQYT